SKFANTVDCVWDRASLIALDKADRKLYVPQISKMLKPKFSYLLETITYEESKMRGPPFSVTPEEVEEHYGKFCKIHALENECLERLVYGNPATFHVFHLTNK
ncbi:NHL repeat-containing E3 ubiquitin protein ligase 1-like protein, partial [Leptotrombidium deliense]